MSASKPSARDSGISLVEVVVTIALLGVAGASVLGAMAGSARGSSVSRSQAGALAWQQSTVDYLAITPYVPCVVGQEAQVDAAYLQQLQSAAAPKSSLGWAQSSLSISGPVMYWNGVSFSSTCTPGSVLEQITVQVSDPLHSFKSQLVMVKSQ